MNSNRLAISAALATGVVYSILSALLAIWPVYFIDVLSKAHYINLSQIIIQLNLTNFITGLVFHMIFMYLFILLLGFFYHLGTGYHKDNRHVNKYEENRHVHEENKYKF